MPRAFDAGFSAGFGGPHNFGTLLLKVGTDAPDPRYQDGDIVCAFNRRRTRHCHAEVICNRRGAGFTSQGLRPSGSLAERYYQRTHQFKFERVSPTTVVRTNLWTGEVDVIGPVPNDKGEQIDVAGYIARRRLSPGHKLFGVEGGEVWYGGQQRFDTPTLDLVWTDIETHSPLREVDHADWPLGLMEFRTHLAIRVNDFDDTEAQALVEPDTEPNPDPDEPSIILKARRRHVPWRSTLRGMSAQRIAKVENRALPVDVRAEVKHVRSQIVRVK